MIRMKKIQPSMSDTSLSIDNECHHMISDGNVKSVNTDSRLNPSLTCKQLTKFPLSTTARVLNFTEKPPHLKLQSKVIDENFSNRFKNISNELFISVNCNRATNSPPPPALSPISPSPAPSSVFNASPRTSPAPLLISKEDLTLNNYKPGMNAPNLVHTNIIPVLSNCQDIANGNFVRNTFGRRHFLNSEQLHSSSESTISSSTSSSSDEDPLPGKTAINELPILEKISVSLIAPKSDVFITNPSISCTTLPTHAQVETLLPTDFKPALGNPLKITASVNENNATPLIKNDNSLTSFVNSKTQNPKKRKLATKRKRTIKKPNVINSDTEYNINRTSNVINRVKKKIARSKVIKSDGKTNNPLQSNLSEVDNNRRRYLESPFFCLCQSSNDLIGNPANIQPSAAPDFSSSRPAHVINPALKDCQFSFLNPFSANCPLLENAKHKSKRNMSTEIGGITSELSSIFMNSLYKPTIRPNARDTRLPPNYQKFLSSFWCCVFCGKDSNYLKIGPIYGPYFLSESTCQKLSAHGYQQQKQPNSAESVAVNTTSESSDVFSSAQTRSSISQGRQTGALRLVIKAISPPISGSVSLSKGTPKKKVTPTTKKSTNIIKKTGDLKNLAPAKIVIQQPQRIGQDGEIWFHMECALWAPGTFVQGDGFIGDVDDAVTIALNVVCSLCKEPGAILSCCSRGCSLCYHFKCAQLDECHFDSEQFTILCKKHWIV